MTTELLEGIAARYRRKGFHAGTRRPRVPVTCELPSGVYCPDILVLRGTKGVRMITVETARTLGDSAVKRWRSFQNPYVPHYVYVPRGSKGEAWSLGFVAELKNFEVVEYDE